MDFLLFLLSLIVILLAGNVYLLYMLVCNVNSEQDLLGGFGKDVCSNLPAAAIDLVFRIKSRVYRAPSDFPTKKSAALELPHGCCGKIPNSVKNH